MTEWTLVEGDCVEVLAGLPEASIHAIVCDPPYGLEFMGKTWDRLDDLGVGQHSSKRPERQQEGDFRGRMGSLPAYNPNTNARCNRCNRWRFSGTPCTCEVPDYPNVRALQAQRQQEWHRRWCEQALRVLKPGGYLLAFGGTRTYHRLASAIEDAGFEIRDSIASLHWVQAQGFPKSLDVSKAIDKAAGAEREVVGSKVGLPGYSLTDGKGGLYGGGIGGNGTGEGECRITAPATDAAREWAGWGSALKPSHEPIVVARKPLVGTLAANVLAHRTGGLNIDGCRVAHDASVDLDAVHRQHATGENNPVKGSFGAAGLVGKEIQMYKPGGRWPPNLLLTHLPGCVQTGEQEAPGYAINRFEDGMKPFGEGAGHAYTQTEIPGGKVKVWDCAPGCPVAELDAQSGIRKSGEIKAGSVHGRDGSIMNNDGTIYGKFKGYTVETEYPSNTGGASRMFPQFEHTAEAEDPYLEAAGFGYYAKPATSEREAGCEGLPTGRWEEDRDPDSAGANNPRSRSQKQRANVHPTVKPIAAMRWLIRLVTPPGGTVLDPFCGSGTTGCAAMLEGFDFIGIEREAEYAAIARARINHWQERATAGDVPLARRAPAAPRNRPAPAPGEATPAPVEPAPVPAAPAPAAAPLDAPRRRRKSAPVEPAGVLLLPF